MRGRILKFTYKQSKSEELWSAAKREGGFRTTPPKPEKPHTIPILPLDANAITRHQSKYITFRHIDVVSSFWYRFRQKHHRNHHITCQQTVLPTFPKKSSYTNNTPFTARRTRSYSTNQFGLLIHISNTPFHHSLRRILDMVIHHPSMTTPIAHAFSLSPRIYRH